MLERRFAQFLAVVLEVGVIRETGVPIIAALDDVLRDAWKVDAGDAGHVRIWNGGPGHIRQWCERTLSVPSSSRSRENVPDPIYWRMLNNATTLDDLRIPPANRLEALKGERKGRHSIRINDQWRVCFIWIEGGPSDVTIVDYHD